MPFKIVSAPNGKRWVVNADTGARKSKRPLTVAKAKAQLRALYANVPEARRPS